MFLMRKVVGRAWGRACGTKMDVWYDPYDNCLCFGAA